MMINLQKISLALSCCMLLCNCMSSKKGANNTLNRKEMAAGWQLLFDGKSLQQWHGYGPKARSSAWMIKDDCILLDAALLKKGIAGGDLVSNKSYQNFHLKYEWKISAGGNSGLIFFIQEDSSRFWNTYSSGPEMQVLDNAVHADGKIRKHRAGDLFDMMEAKPNTLPAGQWNRAEIIAQNGFLQFKMNGKISLQTPVTGSEWQQLIAASKFKDWRGFGQITMGKIALQEHGDSVWYRNIKIREL